MKDQTFKIIFGYSKFEQFYRLEAGRMVCYGYRIDFDQGGNETGRTKPEPLSSIGWGSGLPFTEEDFLALNMPVLQ